MTDEEKVLAAWEFVHRCDGSYRHYPRNTVLVQEKHGEWLDFENWSEAAEFTANRLQAIADVDEEIVLLTCMIVMLRSEPGDQTAPVYQRTIDRLRAHRAELARGMKEKA